MTREQAKRMLPFMQAYAEGKTIQFRVHINDEWRDVKELVLNGFTGEYRIKPELKYRPFKTQEECLEEMHKHSDFGWVKCKDSKSQYHICAVSQGYISVLDADPSFFESFGRYEFLDGTPFGIKEE